MSSAPTAGERWTEEALEALRRGAFRPAAVGAFVTASWRRAEETRQTRPDLARQARRWSRILGGGGLIVREIIACELTPGRAQSAPTRTSVASWSILQGAMLSWHLGMVEGLDGSPRAGLASADAFTLLRGALVPFVAAAPPDGDRFIALLAVAGASDWLDGRLAARRGPTRWGRDFDPLADLCLRAAAVRAARRVGWISDLAAAAHGARSCLLVLGAGASWFGRGRRPPVPHPRRPARLDAVPLLSGLAFGAAGRPRLGENLTLLSALIGTLGMLVRAPERSF